MLSGYFLTNPKSTGIKQSSLKSDGQDQQDPSASLTSRTFEGALHAVPHGCLTVRRATGRYSQDQTQRLWLLL